MAAGKGDTASIKKLLDAGYDIDEKNNIGVTALMFAAMRGEFDAVKLLIKRGAAVNTQSKEGLTALHAASFNGQTKIVQFLLDNGANINLRDKNGNTALDAAKTFNRQEVVNLLSKKGAREKGETSFKVDSDLPKLHRACHEGDLTVVGRLLAGGADVHEKDKEGNTALMHAVIPYGDKRNAASITELLLRQKADINTKNALGISPLRIAATFGDEKLTEFLLTHDADVNAIANDRATALHMAATMGHLAVVKVLISHGDDVNAKAAGKTPLDRAEQMERTDVVRELKRHGAR